MSLKDNHGEVEMWNGLDDDDTEAVVEAVTNTFCPTGAGGGIDPTCGSTKGGGGGISGVQKTGKNTWKMQEGGTTYYIERRQARSSTKIYNPNVVSIPGVRAPRTSTSSTYYSVRRSVPGQEYAQPVGMNNVPPKTLQQAVGVAKADARNSGAGG
jgi:hypothetical protein